MSARCEILKIDLRSGEVTGLWHATSPNMPTFRVTETSREEALRQIPIVLEAFCKIDGEPVCVFQLEPQHADDLQWVIVQKSEVRRQIELAYKTEAP
jgi:hypothetical protein